MEILLVIGLIASVVSAIAATIAAILSYKTAHKCDALIRVD